LSDLDKDKESTDFVVKQTKQEKKQISQESDIIDSEGKTPNLYNQV